MIEVGESEKERHASAVEGLLLIQDSQFAIDARWNANENRKYERYRAIGVQTAVEVMSTCSQTQENNDPNSAASPMSPIATPSASIAPSAYGYEQQR